MSVFLTEFPPALRWVMAVGITVAATLLMVRIFHDRAVALSEREPKMATFDLSDRLLALTTTAFVFLLAFTLNNFWQNSKAATAATQAEAGYLARASLQAEGDPVAVRALADYEASVMQQWPLMARGDSPGAYRLQLDAGTNVIRAMPDSAEVGDMLEQGRLRVDALPGAAAPGAVGVVILLGVGMLAFTAAFRPARLGVHLTTMALMAVVVATLLFLLIEASNPYAGGAGVQWPR